MYLQYKTPGELRQLKFSVWNRTQTQGHALFTGDITDTFRYLEQADFENVEVSALDLRDRHSLDPVTGTQWLYWYYIKALPILEEINKQKDVISVPDLGSSSTKFILVESSLSDD